MRILVDCDGVLSDFVGMFLDYVEHQYGLSYPRAAIDQWDPFLAMGMAPEWGRFAALVGPLELCRRMAPLPGSAAFLVGLESIGEVKVATTPVNGPWLAQRAEWLEEHMGIPLDRQIHVHSKEDLAGAWDLLIDDRVENCVAFARAGGRAYCIAAPYNAYCPPEIPRGSHADCLDWVAELVQI